MPVIIAGCILLSNAQTAFENNRFDLAAGSFEEAARSLPWRDDLYEKAGISAWKNQDPERAISLFLRTKQLSEEGLFSLASSYFYIGDISKAKAYFLEGSVKYKSVPFYQGLALIYRKEKNWESEAEALRNAVALGLDDPYSYYRLGLLFAGSDPDLALKNLMTASSLNPEFDPAVQTMRSALNLSDVQTVAVQRFLAVGRALGLVNEWELALDVFEKAVLADEQNAEAWAWLGEARQQTGQDGGDAIRKAVSINGTSSIVLGLSGMYWNREGNYPLMLEAYKAAALADPANPAWPAEVGNSHAKNGDLVSALASYQEAVSLSLNDPTYLLLLVSFCHDYQIHLEDIAFPAAELAVKMDPDRPEALDALGWTYYALGQYTHALDVLIDAAERFPDRSGVRLHLGMTQLVLGNRQEAYQELIFVRDLDSNASDTALARKLIAQYFP